MTKKETYLTCDYPNVYEGMTSISALIKRCELSNDICEKINKVMVDKAKIKSKARELSFLRQKSSKFGFIIELVDANVIDKYTTGSTHGGIIAFSSPRDIPALFSNIDKIHDHGAYIMLDGIEDPYNFGYSVRSVYSAGIDGIIIPKRNWMTVAGIVAKSSAGASELIDMYVSDPEEAINLFKDKGYKIICSGIRNSISMYDADMKKPVFLIVGGEKRGISSSIEKNADLIARVEYGREFKGSLSTASAATIMAYEIFRQNKQ